MPVSVVVPEKKSGQKRSDDAEIEQKAEDDVDEFFGILGIILKQSYHNYLQLFDV